MTLKTFIDENGEVRAGHFVRTPYNYDTDEISDETGTYNNEKSITKQEFKDDADINVLVERFEKAGELPPQLTWPDQTEFMETYDYQTAMNVVVKAREAFMELPAKARARFENDPQKFMRFMEDPENQDEAIKLGIATDNRKKETPIETVKKEPEKEAPKE